MAIKPVLVKTTMEVPSVLDIMVAWYANISLMWFYRKHEACSKFMVDDQNERGKKVQNAKVTCSIEKHEVFPR